jgi:hypothetical protein
MASGQSSSPQRVRRGNMKKLNRGQRKRQKKIKELTAKAIEEGRDPSEVLEKAGLLDAKTGDRDVAPPKRPEQGDSKKKEKAAQRIQELKMKRKHSLDLNSGDAVEKQITEAATCSDVLWHAYASLFGHEENVRASCGLHHDSFHSSSPVGISNVEAILESEGVFAEQVLQEPAAIFISSSALGALDCIKACKSHHKENSIAKLFAKHMKVSEQVSMLEKYPLYMATGTPNRILKLAQDNHLKFSRLSCIVIDMRRNKKNQTIVDIPDVASDFWALWDSFCRQHILPQGHDEGTALKTGAKILCVI